MLAKNTGSKLSCCRRIYKLLNYGGSYYFLPTHIFLFGFILEIEIKAEWINFFFFMYDQRIVYNEPAL